MTTYDLSAPRPCRWASRQVLLAFTIIAVLGTPVAASFLQPFMGNARSIAEGRSSLDATWSFAVLTNDGPDGDRFGTGLAGFDEGFLAASGSPTLDTSASYLYLLQTVNDGSGAVSFTRLQTLAAGLTSWGRWGLVFADSEGLVGANNPFGAAGSHAQLGPARLGVAEPAVAAPAGTIRNHELTRSGQSLNSRTFLGARSTSGLFGFTTDIEPRLRLREAEECPDDIACFSIPVPVRAGDYDYDGVVTLADWDTWRASYGDRPSNVGFQADGNADGVINAADYTVWRDAYEATGTSRSVPEPAAVTLLVLIASCWSVSPRSRR